MALSYAIYINKERVKGVEIGFSTTDNWDEAMDDMSFTVRTTKHKTPFPMLSLVEVVIDDGDETKTKEYVLIDDVVREFSKYGWYKHDVYAIEYTEKLNRYLISAFASSKQLDKRFRGANAYINSGTGIHGGGHYTSLYPYYNYTSGNNSFGIYVFSEKLDIKLEYIQGQDIIIPKINQADQATFWSTAFGMGVSSPMVKSDLYISGSFFAGRKQISGVGAPNETVISTTGYEGKHYINLEVYAHDRVDGNNEPIADDFVWLLRYEFNIVPMSNLSIYDVVMSVSDLVSKFGSIERRDLFDSTRVFEIDTEVAEYLKTVEAPEIYLEKTTALQTINFILTYVNGIARLHNTEHLDQITIDYFNKSQGEFNWDEAITYGSKQSADQLGTHGTSFFQQALPTNLNEPNISIPNDNWYKTVRGTELQMTDTTFELKLDKSKPLYAPTKLEAIIPKIIVEGSGFPIISKTFTDARVDLTNAWINIDEWNLKHIHDNFPSVYQHKPFEQGIFDKPYKMENLFWQKGDTSIKMSNTFGVDFKTQHIETVLRTAILEYVVMNFNEALFEETKTIVDVETDTEIEVDYYKVAFVGAGAEDFFGGDYWFKDVKFYVEYITDNNLVVKHDKEDLTEIDFYSEMKINQDENIINLTRGSRKAYGELQRTSNKQVAFQKVHHKLEQQYVMGMTDINDFTITNVETQWHNYHFLSTYTVTKHFNRIAQATFIDQAYRPFYQYNKDIMVRKDNYKDYLIATPPDIATDTVVNSLISNRAINVILSTLKGRRYVADETTKASTVLIRTDGTLWHYPDDDINRYYNFVTTPLSAAGVKGGFTFDFSFAHNLIAEDFIEKDAATQSTNAWYNRAIRYTDEYGRVRYLEFIILDGTLPFEQDLDGRMIELLERYPLMRLTELETQMSTIYRYFGMESVVNEASSKSLIINKDTRTNYGLTYQVGIVSKYFRMYIFGQSFYSKNFIVSNVADFMNDTMYFYGYADAPNYKIFEDLKVKKGYRVKIPITNNNFVIVPTAIQGGAGVRFQGNLNTSSFVAWALGDSEGNLYVAHNGQYNGFDLIPTHFREGLKEIGKKPYEFSHVVRERTTANLGVLYNDIDVSGEVVSLVLEPNTELNALKAERHKTQAVITVSVDDENVYGEVLLFGLDPDSEVESSIAEQYKETVIIGVESSQENIQGEQLELGFITYTDVSVIEASKFNSNLGMAVSVSEFNTIGEDLELGLKPQTTKITAEHGNKLITDATITVEVQSENIIGETTNIRLVPSSYYGDGISTLYDSKIDVGVSLDHETYVGELESILITTLSGYSGEARLSAMIDTALSRLIGYSSSDIVGSEVEIGLRQSTFYNHGTSAKYDTTIPTTVELSQEDLFGEVVGVGVNLSILYGDIVLVDMIIDTVLSMLVGYNSSDIVGSEIEIGLRQSTFYKHGTGAKYDTTIPTGVNTRQENIVGETVEVRVNNSSSVSIIRGTGVSYDDTITFGVSTVEEHITQSDYQEVAFKPSALTNTRLLLPTTATPSLSLGCINGILSATVTNNDENTANIAVTGAITSNLTSVSSGVSNTLYASGQLLGLVTVRAMATADGKASSSLISKSYYMGFCSFE